MALQIGAWGGYGPYPYPGQLGTQNPIYQQQLYQQQLSAYMLQTQPMPVTTVAGAELIKSKVPDEFTWLRNRVSEILWRPVTA